MEVHRITVRNQDESCIRDFQVEACLDRIGEDHILTKDVDEVRVGNREMVVSDEVTFSGSKIGLNIKRQTRIRTDRVQIVAEITPDPAADEIASVARMFTNDR